MLLSTTLVVGLAACDAAGPEAVTAGAAQELGAVCHYDAVTGTYDLLSLPAVGAAAHGRQHDRDYVGADYEGQPVEDMDGFAFDAACVPVPVSGQRVAFTSLRDGNEEVYVVDADRSNLQRLTDDPNSDIQPSISG